VIAAIVPLAISFLVLGWYHVSSMKQINAKGKRIKMATINPYLNFNGNTEEAFNFYKSVFGGEFATLMRFEDFPQTEVCDGVKIAENELEKIMHIALPIGNGNVLMATDGLESMGQKFTEGNNFSISIGADSKEEAETLFNGLSQGGKVEMPLGDTFWGSYFGMLQDKFGVSWMVNYDYKSK
jgi:PhnB protein